MAFMSMAIRSNVESLENELETKTENIHGQFIELFRTSINVLDGFNAYIQSTENINYNNFDQFSTSILHQHPHIYMTQYMVRVGENEIDSFITDQRSSGYANYEIKELDENDQNNFVPITKRESHFPLTFISPATEHSSRFLGYDIYSHPDIKKAIDRSITMGGSSVASQPLYLPNEKLAYIILKPIFLKDHIPDELPKRHTAATRIVALVIRIEDLIDDIELGNRYILEVSNFDSHKKSFTILGTSNDKKHEQNTFLPVKEIQKTIDITGQLFRIKVKRHMLWSDFDYNWIMFYLFISTAFSILLFNISHLRIQRIREREKAQSDLYKERELAEVTLHSIDEAVIATDINQNIKFMNPIACLLTGWSANEVVGKPLDEVFRLFDETTKKPIENTLARCLDLQCTVRSENPAILIKRDGSEFVIENSSAIIRDQNYNTTGAVLVFRNITHVRDMSKKMEFQATHDALTELINRREFEQRLKHAIQSANNDGHQHALCYMDLDQFKIVNDTCGHIAGDQLLRELSKLMPHTIRASDCLARLGGDEFGVLMFDCPVHQAKRIAESLRSTIKNFTFKWDKKIFDVGVSIGLVPIHENSGSLQEIMSRADSACYIAKDLGRNRIHVYTDDDQAIAERQGEMMWLTEIQSALKEERFKLFIQPIMPVKNNTGLMHYEILLRMEDKDGKTIPPMSFLPAADRYDMMPKIDRWVIETSLTKISHEIKHKKNSFYNINLSGQTLHDKSIVGFIQNKIKQLNIPPEIICFEITETAVISNFSTAIELINILKDFGCKFALDDFGSGLSSFSYLKKLPVDYLKIDGEFVQDILFDQMDKAIVTSICNIAHEMGIKTVAEYVESTGILALCTEIGVDYVQGYAIEKPYPWTPENVIPIKIRSNPNS